MGEIKRDWFDPTRLFDEGYPAELTSALREMPQVYRVMTEEIDAVAARSALEIGPGDLPLIGRVPRRAYLDLVPGFLAPMAGLAVRGNVLAIPFVDGAFDLVVAADLLTHLRPNERPEALAEISRVARAAILFNPEPGTPDVGESPVPTEPIVQWLEAHGSNVRVRRFRAFLAHDYEMTIIIATR